MSHSYYPGHLGPGFQQKITKHDKRKKKLSQSEETKQASEPDLDRTQMLELSGRTFKGTTINMLRALVEEVGNMKKHMGNSRKESKGNAINKKHSNRNEECL